MPHLVLGYVQFLELLISQDLDLGASIPIVLLVGRESRIVASKFYARSFATPRAAPARTYLDFQRHTLFLDHLSRHSYEGG
jgi:hypothetical protein